MRVSLCLMEAVVFNKKPNLQSSEKCLQRRFYNTFVIFIIFVIFVNQFHQREFPVGAFFISIGKISHLKIP